MYKLIKGVDNMLQKIARLEASKIVMLEELQELIKRRNTIEKVLHYVLSEEDFDALENIQEDLSDQIKGLKRSIWTIQDEILETQDEIFKG
jgi:seryl-tRNA synthetase